MERQNQTYNEKKKLWIEELTRYYHILAINKNLERSSTTTLIKISISSRKSITRQFNSLTIVLTIHLAFYT